MRQIASRTGFPELPPYEFLTASRQAADASVSALTYATTSKKHSVSASTGVVTFQLFTRNDTHAHGQTTTPELAQRTFYIQSNVLADTLAKVERTLIQYYLTGTRRIQHLQRMAYRRHSRGHDTTQTPSDPLPLRLRLAARGCWCFPLPLLMSSRTGLLDH